MRNFPTINDVEQLMKKKEIEEESRKVLELTKKFPLI